MRPEQFEISDEKTIRRGGIAVRRRGLGRQGRRNTREDLERRSGRHDGRRSAILKIQPRYTILFMPVDRRRNAESISGLAPEAAAPFTTVVGKEATVTLEKLRSLASGARRTTSWGGAG